MAGPGAAHNPIICRTASEHGYDPHGRRQNCERTRRLARAATANPLLTKTKPNFRPEDFSLLFPPRSRRGRRRRPEVRTGGFHESRSGPSRICPISRNSRPAPGAAPPPSRVGRSTRARIRTDFWDPPPFANAFLPVNYGGQESPDVKRARRGGPRPGHEHDPGVCVRLSRERCANQWQRNTAQHRTLPTGAQGVRGGRSDLGVAAHLA